MSETLREQVANLGALIEEGSGLQSQLKEALKEQQELSEEVNALVSLATKEHNDVKALEGLSLKALWLTISGSKEEAVSKEKAEAIAASLRVQEGRESLKLARARSDSLSDRLEVSKGAKPRYDEAIAKLKEELIAAGGDRAAELLEASEREGELIGQINKTKEAVEAGQDARNIIAKILGYLDEASTSNLAGAIGGAGMVAILGAGTNKYDSLGDAHVDSVDAQHALKRMNNALEGTHVIEAEVYIHSEMMRFADNFVDSLIPDIHMQGKISESLVSMRSAHGRVEELLEKLEPALAEKQEALAALRKRSATLTVGSEA